MYTRVVSFFGLRMVGDWLPIVAKRVLGLSPDQLEVIGL